MESVLLSHYKFVGCREEIKKINRDKAQLSERLKEAEGAQLRLDGEVQSLKAAAAVSGERHDAVVAQLEKRLQRAQEAVQAKQEEVKNCPFLPPTPSPLPTCPYSYCCFSRISHLAFDLILSSLTGTSPCAV